MGFWENFKQDFKESYKQNLEEKGIENPFEQSADSANKGHAPSARQGKRDRIKELKRQGIAYCPKCKGTSIQYMERRKRLSLGRAVTGGVLLGPMGAGVGAITSKKYKGSVKCLNCGHSWKK